MPNVSEKKRKLLCLLQVLWENTDTEHTMTLPELLQELENRGVPAERKSLYDDIETLRSVGVDIRTRKQKTYQYFIEKRIFSMRELRLLAEAAAASSFIPAGQANLLIGKLGELCSTYQADDLRRREYPALTSPKLEGAALSTAELLYRAIAENRKVSVQLAEWRLSQQGKPECAVKKGEKPRVFNPWKLLLEQNHGVLLCSDTETAKLQTLPLERLAELEILSEARDSSDLFPAPEGKGEKLVLEFPSDRLGVVAERFGADFTAEPAGKNRVKASLKAILSPDLFTWLFSQGPDIRLIAPKKLAEQFRERAKALAKLYKA